MPISKNNAKKGRSFSEVGSSASTDLELLDEEATATGGGWKRFWGCTSYSDPSVGRFSVSMDSSSIPEIFVWSGPWNSQIFNGIPEMNSVYMDVFNIAKSEDGTVSLSFTYVNQPISNYVLSSDGKLLERAWKVENQDCCLRGFVPKNPDDWNKGNWTSGCIRRTPLECTETQNRSEVNPKDGFLKLEMIKVPDFAEWSSLYSELECRSTRLSKVPDFAEWGIGCMFWTRSLIDIHKFSIGGADLYLRIAYSDLGLLCVQEFAKDRPAVPTIISMLHSEIVDLPAPKKPALGFDMDSLQWSQTICSNGITTTVIGGR
ncbi:hypothetical protein OIU84_013994 [Salix udensis]|uniref:S-locus glycoprotein domain-containing protein n=1 Tax=Salix udensis TaxID=889485 RepID=A0AAD6NQM4_9ROSI|nr:hypothetical protein OIU84_013994 [Salix udensis]